MPSQFVVPTGTPVEFYSWAAERRWLVEGHAEGRGAGREIVLPTTFLRGAHTTCPTVLVSDLVVDIDPDASQDGG